MNITKELTEKVVRCFGKGLKPYNMYALGICPVKVSQQILDVEIPNWREISSRDRDNRFTQGERK